ncbi:NAD(P)-dependent oxidoreductase [Gryllotalpicola ginsengisoli]|uniref:NAD(P)-dependent oxidoreductase n=1 Tax=Gryllotalpicola ginsengisoli TaxID=444608 RepID=UPI0003B5ED16|nr:NAD(P)-dependent oxidoreductase [Gryllotalpicola ginsengisoli]
MKIAFLGLGRMGRELVMHLIDAGHDVTVWNRSPEPRQEVAERGATAADSPAAAVEGADAVITVLFGPDSVREVVVDQGLLGQGAAWIDVTTVSPADAAEFAAWAAERGVTYVYSPVIGTVVPAREGTLGVLIGGSPAAVETARPLVTRWADPERVHVYGTPQAAASAKLVANLAVATTMQALADALVLGHSGGLTTDQVLELLGDKTPLAAMAGLKGDFVRSGVFEPAQFTLDALAKDLGLMISTADRPLRAVEVVYETARAAQQAGFGSSDFSVMARDAL